MGDLGRFFTVIGAVFAAAKGITDQFKARWPWLGQPLDNPEAEKKRELRVIAFNAVVAALLAGMATVDIFALLGLEAFAGLKASYPGLYRLINMVAAGLMSTFGSPFLHEILSILIEFKENIRLHNQQAALKLLPAKKSETTSEVNKNIS